MDAAFVLRIALGVFVGILLLWVGLVGRPGSLIAAIITPDALQEMSG